MWSLVMQLTPEIMSLLIIGFLTIKEAPNIWRLGRSLRLNAGGDLNA